jgi:hypothetical protein
LLYPGEVFFYSHLEKIITEYSYKCKKKVEENPEGEISTEKWKHLKHVLPEEVHPVRNSSGALNPAGIIIKPDSAAQQRGIISSGVNIISYCSLGSALAGQSEGLKSLTTKFSQKWQKALTSK